MRWPLPLTEVSVEEVGGGAEKIQSTHGVRIWYLWMGCVVDGTKGRRVLGWLDS